MQLSMRVQLQRMPLDYGTIGRKSRSKRTGHVNPGMNSQTRECKRTSSSTQSVDGKDCDSSTYMALI